MCAEPGWKPQFNGELSNDCENAAYAAALDQQNVCTHQAKDNETYTSNLKAASAPGFLPISVAASNSSSSSSSSSSTSSISSPSPMPAGMSDAARSNTFQAAYSTALDVGARDSQYQVSATEGVPSHRESASCVPLCIERKEKRRHVEIGAVAAVLRR